METYKLALDEYGQFFLNDWLYLVGGVAVMIVWLASGSFAASIAEDRLRSPVFHFIVGMIVPVIYPLAILFTLPVYLPPDKKANADAKASEELFEKVAGAPPPESGSSKGSDELEMVDVDMLASSATSTLGGGTSLTGHTRFDAAYFRKISRDETGSARGPFLITVEGNEVRVEHILDANENVVVVERIGSDNKNTKLRIPYHKIENCVEI